MQLRLKRTRIHPGAGQLTDNFAVFCFFGEHSYSFYTILSFALDAKLVNIKPVKICYKCREKSVCTDANWVNSPGQPLFLNLFTTSLVFN